MRSVPLPQAPADREGMARPEGVLPAQTYADLRLRRFGNTARVTSDLRELRKEFPGMEDEVLRDPLRAQASLEQRGSQRAYDGAPPVVPHAMDAQPSGSCPACHGEGLLVAGRLAPRIPHVPYASCAQCHAWGGSVGQPSAAANAFVGAWSERVGDRAWEGAPPTIPHGTWLRSDCAACHGLTGRPGLRTSHPERQQCVQCHGSSGLEPPWAQ